MKTIPLIMVLGLFLIGQLSSIAGEGERTPLFEIDPARKNDSPNTILEFARVEVDEVEFKNAPASFCFDYFDAVLRRHWRQKKMKEEKQPYFIRCFPIGINSSKVSLKCSKTNLFVCLFQVCERAKLRIVFSGKEVIVYPKKYVRRKVFYSDGISSSEKVLKQLERKIVKKHSLYGVGCHVTLLSWLKGIASWKSEQDDQRVLLDFKGISLKDAIRYICLAKGWVCNVSNGSLSFERKHSPLQSTEGFVPVSDTTGEPWIITGEEKINFHEVVDIPKALFDEMWEEIHPEKTDAEK